jgi:nucleoid DNA-binding protein
MVIRKEDILSGVDSPQLVYIEALEDEIPMRPLSKKEINEVDKIEAKAYGKFETSERANRNGMRQQKGGDSEISTKGIVDLEKSTAAAFEGKTHAIMLSLNNGHDEADQWSKKDVQNLPNKVFEELFKAVQRISGIDVEEKEIDDFRQD